ncbi:MAG: hypothetical protein QOK37_1825 [Thermoanaerobaculia bacterium]|jgi:hypothetical protein|nr:hypothetical protein [Thermoanaerobaculia bacterium]
MTPLDAAVVRFAVERLKYSIIAATLLLFTAGAFGQFTKEVPVSTPVDQAVTGVFYPASIASDGDRFLAAWCDQRDRGAVYAARIARDGTILDPHGIFLANTNSPVVVAWIGDRYLVAWNAASSIVGAQLGADGHLLAPPRAIVAPGWLSQGLHPIATNGNVFVLMTSGGYSVLNREANIVDNGRFGESAYVTGVGEFALTALGNSRHLDAAGHYVRSSASTWRQVIACRAGGCLTAVPMTSMVGVASYDAGAMTVGKTANLPIAATSLDLIATADGYLLVTDSVAQRLDDDGHLIGSAIALPGANGGSVRAAWNGRDAAVLRNTSQGLTSFVISSSGVTKAVDVAVSANAQRDIAIAKGNANYLTVWTERDGAYAGRLTLDGIALDGRGIYLGRSIAKPPVVFDGQSYLAVLAHPFSVYPAEDVLRIDPASGAVISTATIEGSNLRIASNGSERVGVWVDVAGGVVAAFLTPSGSLASVPVFLAVPPPPQPLTVFLANVTLTWNGDLWLVTWEEQVYPLPTPMPPPIGGPYVTPPGTMAVKARRLSAALTAIDTQSITIASSAPFGALRSSRVASDGRDFLVAWSSDAIHVRRLLSSGSLGASTTLTAAALQDLIWDGAVYDLAVATGQPAFTPGDLVVARLTPSGELRETLVISATADDDRGAALISLDGGRALAAYTRVAHEPPYGGVERAFVAAPYAVRRRGARAQ